MKKTIKLLFSSFALLSLISCVNTQPTSSSQNSGDSSIIPISITSSKVDDIYYTVTFLNYDDTLLGTDRVILGGEAHYNGETPKRAADDEYTYTFKGWDEDLSSITSDITTKATYEQVAIDWGTIHDWY